MKRSVANAGMNVATSGVMNAGITDIITVGNPSPQVEVGKVAAPTGQSPSFFAGRIIPHKISTGMTAPTTLFQPFSGLVKITILGREFEVPENNHLLRCFQYLAPEQVSYGRFCWNEDCQYCRVGFDSGEGTQTRAALSCKLMAQDGLRVTELSTEIRYCLRTLKLPRKTEEGT